MLLRNQVHDGEDENPHDVDKVPVQADNFDCLYLVGAMFMHLKFDSKIFRRFLITGIVLAGLCYTGMFLIFNFFGK